MAGTPPVVSYTYRPDGLRVSKTLASGTLVTYTWDINTGLPVIVQDSNYSYVYGLGGLISQTDAAGNQTYFLGNGLGSTEKLTDGSGNVTGSYKYDVFGAVRSSSGTGWTEYRFTGQEDDATLGYTYLRARYYDPNLGRFTQKDTIVPGFRDPQALNRFSYVLNNPVRYTDPTGHCVEDLCIVEVVVAAYLATAVTAAVTAYVEAHNEEIQNALRAAGDAAGDFCASAAERIAEGPRSLKPVSAHVEKAKRKGARQSGVSVQEIYEDPVTGKRTVKHTLSVTIEAA